MMDGAAFAKLISSAVYSIRVDVAFVGFFITALWQRPGLRLVACTITAIVYKL